MHDCTEHLKVVWSSTHPYRCSVCGQKFTQEEVETSDILA